ncbi:MAG: potassium-transporting ATPase subunit KdpC [Spirochaetia bacterium]|jgi:K+-transporting ATPase ATPase C chain
MKPIRTAIIVLVFWTVVVGGIYPLLMTGVGAVLFPAGAQGSLVEKGGKVVGSTLLAQDFSSDVYFHPRPSAAKYDPTSSGASNWGWTSSDLKKAYDQRRSDWQKAYGAGDPPMDMLFASGSGLDPEISPEAAEAQVKRVADARHFDATGQRNLLTLVRRFEEAPQLGFLGEPRVNVLALNLALDKEFPK